MYKVITKFTRPSDNIPYYLDSDASVKNSFVNFITANRSDILGLYKVDESTTVQVNTATYQDEATFNIFMTKFNEVMPSFFADRDAYCASNNIIIERSVETT